MVTRHTSQTRIQTHQEDCAHDLAGHRFHANPKSISSPIGFHLFLNHEGHKNEHNANVSAKI